MEDQPRTGRILDLIETPAAIRWVSAEPLLGGLDLLHIKGGPIFSDWWHDALSGFRWVQHGGHCQRQPALDWVVAGGESGSRARPTNPQWFRDLRDQCAAASVPFFFKQWGEWVSVSEVEGGGEHHSFADGRTVRRIGKKAAGAHLDRVQHKAWPFKREVQP